MKNKVGIGKLILSFRGRSKNKVETIQLIERYLTTIPKITKVFIWSSNKTHAKSIFLTWNQTMNSKFSIT